MSTTEIRQTSASLVTQPPLNRGELDDRCVVKWRQALFIVIGMIALAVLGTGFAAFGAHHNYWTAEALSHLSQLDANIMIGVGSVLAFIVGIVCLDKFFSTRESQKSLRDRNDDDHTRGHYDPLEELAKIYNRGDYDPVEANRWVRERELEGAKIYQPEIQELRRKYRAQNNL